MRVVRLDTLPKESLGEATPIAGWTGGSVTRTRQTIIADNASDDYRCSIVKFQSWRYDRVACPHLRPDSSGHSPTSRSRRPAVRAAGDRAGSSGLHRSHHWLADEL